MFAVCAMVGVEVEARVEARVEAKVRIRFSGWMERERF
jgi:hypothetical protein